MKPITLFFVIVISFFVLGTFASAAPLTYTYPTTLSLDSPAVNLVVASGSVADSVVVNATSVFVAMSASTGGTFTLTASTTDLALSASAGGGSSPTSCTNKIASTTISQSSGSATYTIAPTGTQCSVANNNTTSTQSSASVGVGGGIGYSMFATVTITAPAPHTLVRGGMLSLAATALTATNIAHVWFTVDGTMVGTKLAAVPYATAFDTGSLAAGAHTLFAYADDAFGDTAISSPVIFTIGSSTANGTASDAELRATIATLQAQLQALLAQVQSQGVAISLPGASRYNFTRNLSLWSAGADVKVLQQYLIAKDAGSAARSLAAHGGATSVFGRLTYNALKEFQASVGIRATGFFGPATRAYIKIH